MLVRISTWKVSASCLCLCSFFLRIIYSYIFNSWSWIMQNVMAFSLAINALSYYRLGTYKTVTILLSVFFIYDIFMVFVTPQFTKVSLGSGNYSKNEIIFHFHIPISLIYFSWNKKKKGTSIMEAVAFGGKDASDTTSGTVSSLIYCSFFFENRAEFQVKLFCF